MRRISRPAIAALVVAAALGVLLVGAAAAGAWLLYTEAGLAWLATRVVGIAGEGLTLDGVAGTLARGASARRIRYVGEDIEARVSDAALRVSPWSLLRLTPRIDGLRAAELAVVMKPGEPRGRPPDTLELPANFELREAYIQRLVIDLGKGPMDLSEVRLSFSGGKTRHDVHELSLHAFEYAIKLQGTIDARAPFALKAAVTAEAITPPLAQLEATIGGNLSAMQVEASAHSGKARIAGSALIEPYAELPLAKVQARIAALDVQAFVKTLPRTAIDGELELTRKGSMLAGPARLANALHGPYDQGRVPLASVRLTVLTDAAELHRFELAADLGKAGAVSGSGELKGSAARLVLSTRNLNLAGAHTRMRETQLAGQAAISISREHQSIDAKFAQGDIDLSFVANRAGERIDIPRFRAQARGGEASGAARVALAGEQPFSVDATFARFDPRAWGDFPAGSINGTVHAEGAIAGRAADIRLAIRDSRWLDAPLAAQGTISVSPERVHRADIDATVGGNRLMARGAFGMPKDVLNVRFEASRLDIFDKRLQGSARGTAQLSGTLRAPSVRFDVAASDLAHKEYGRVKGLQAKGNVSAEPAGALEIDATARGVAAFEWRLTAASLRVEGTRDAHSGTLQAQGERLDLRARARGGWRAGAGWSGSIQELVNSGEAAVSLTNPVSLTIGPQRVQAEAFELRFVGGRLYVNAVKYERGRLSTAGRFTDMPVRPLLAIARVPAAERAGTLRLSGQWSLEDAPRLIGSISITRESGDIALAADRTIPLGLQALALNASFTEGGASIQAQLRSAFGTASAEGRIAPVGAGSAARYTGASPMSFTAAIDVSQLGAFASLIDTTVLLEGRLHAKLQGSGTLADPQVTGPIVGERLAFALPAEGIELKGGTLKAALTQREIRVESFSIRGGEGVFAAQGTLARTGFDEASVDWRADKFTVLSRPDRRLTVSGKGNAALRAGKLAFTGELKADAGVFELATTTLPTLGDDVVIVGRSRESAAEPATTGRITEKRATRAAVDMKVDLGNNVHLHGRGLDVWLSGELRVQTDAQGQLRAEGVIDARRGTFAAYGQRLEIERGRFYFNGPITDPALDIIAMRKRQAVEAGVAVTGTISRPLIRIVSNPQLPEGEALSWLLLGRAPDQAGASQVSALPLATSALIGKAGGPLARALNVDEVGVRSGSAAQPFLTVGKRLTERLYLAFEQSIGGTENLLRLEMSLTERIALRAQAGTNNAVGVFYRYAWD